VTSPRDPPPDAPVRPAWGDRVLSIVTLLVIAMLVVGLVAGGRWSEIRGDSRDFAAMRIRDVGHAVEAYRRRTRSVPADLDALLAADPASGEPYLERVPLDPWGRPFRYVVTDERRGRFEVSSAGPDRRFDTDDDVRSAP
jgi:general secretion pathway protein G